MNFNFRRLIRKVLLLFLLPAVSLLSACGFYVLGSNFNLSNGASRWVAVVTAKNLSEPLLQQYKNLARSVSGFEVQSGKTTIIMPLPESSSATPSKVANRWILTITDEVFERTANITDSSTINQEIRFVYYLQYQLSTTDGMVWRSGELERTAESNFNESERLSSERIEAKVKAQLYLQVARSLLQVTLITQPDATGALPSSSNY